MIQLEDASGGDTGIPLFRAGFRPFFLLAGLQAALSVPLWLAQLFGEHSLGLRYAPQLWHGHEMIFGYGGAAVAGFLLTAVPNWTGAVPVRGRPLMVLAGLWVAARIALLAGAAVPDWLGPVLALPFFPLLGLLLARPLIQAGKFRNITFLPILAVLTGAEALVGSEMMGLSSLGRSGLYLGLFVLLTMIGIIGGRIIPGFTSGGLRQIGVTMQPKDLPWLNKLAILSLVLTAVAWSIAPGSMVAGALAIVAGVAHGLRHYGWQGWKTGKVPLLWVLHLGYGWLWVGLLLLGGSCFLPQISQAAALHGLTVGAVGLMTLGVMTRAALGHSGRSLKPARRTVAAYGLVALAAVVRVFGVQWGDAQMALHISAVIWSLAFLSYLSVYAPICLYPRADGRAG